MAVEVLIRLINSGGGREAGDIIAARQLPHQGWGLEEGLPTYAVVRITNVDLPNFKQFHDRHYHVQDVNGDVWGARSRYRVNLGALPTAVRNALFSTGFYSGVLNTFSSRMVEKSLRFIRTAPSDGN